MLFCAGTVSAADDAIFVNGSSGLDTNDGYSWSSPKLTIQNATGTVSSNGIVNIADGVYSGYGNTDITIDRNMTIQGLSQNGTIINANYQNRIFYINPGITVILQNLTLANGNTTEFGGAIRNMMGNLTVTGCTFTNNTASNGGAIGNYAYRGTVTCTVNDSTFTNNHANTQGGAIYNNLDYWGGPLTCTVTKSTFTNNQAGYGGAIYNVNTGGGTALIITDSTFTNNQALFNGGAILNSNFGMGSLNCTVTGSTFNQNQAIYYGGALYNYNHVGSLNCVANFSRFYNNNATTSGDAIYNDGSNVDYENNWWGSNDPVFTSLLVGVNSPTNWLYMTINATPKTINNTQTSLITVSFNNYYNGSAVTPYTPGVGEYIPDGSPVNFQTDLGTIGCKSIDKTTLGGIATATLTASELAGTAHINATTDNQTVYTNVLINPKSSLYLNITPDKTNPVAGDTVTYRFKVGNYGPDSADNVLMTFKVPDGLVFVGATDNIGNTWTYDSNTRTITWNLSTVPKGDPDLWVSFLFAAAGDYLINPLLITTTYDPDLNANTQSIRVSAATTPTTSTTSVNAATTTSGNTVGMQATGAPIVPLAIGILSVLGGLAITRKKQ